MKRSFRIVAALLLSSNVMADAPNQQPEKQTIPLDQIWAYEMPGTRDIQELAKEADMRRLGSITESWFHRAVRLKFKDVARPGFAVSGSGLSALRAALATFADGGTPREKFSPDDEITIVFFSEPAGRCVEIRQVKRKGNKVEIRYSLKPKYEGYRFNLALIPVGQMPVGEYRVEMRQLPHELNDVEIKMGFKPLDEKWSRNFLCKPFSFTVTENDQ